MGILTQEEHDAFAKMFPKVKSRCPVCYISNHIERKVKEAINKYFSDEEEPQKLEVICKIKKIEKELGLK